MLEKVLTYTCVVAFCMNICLFGTATILEQTNLQILSIGNMFLLSFALLRKPKNV